MIRIAVCDHELYYRNTIKELAVKYLEQKGLFYQVNTFDSGRELLQTEFEIMNYTAVFLQININEMDGFETAQKIRSFHKDIFIILIEADALYGLDGYKVGAFRYLKKNSIDFTESVGECIKALIEKGRYKVSEKTFKFSEGIRNVPLDRILYIESNLHKLEFHIMGDCSVQYTLYQTLNALEVELWGYGYLRIHQSFLVNMKHIRDITRYTVELNNGEQLVIPKVRYKCAKDTFTVFKAGKYC